MKDFFRVLARPQLFVIAVVLAIVAGYQWDHPTSTALTQSPAAEPFTVVALPDTQIYTESYPDRFAAQTAWIAANKETLNIAFVTHLGDIVQHVGSKAEWQVATSAMHTLDGVVPYGIAPGNHDMLPDTTTPLYSQHFPISRLRQSGAYGGGYQSSPGYGGTTQDAGGHADENSYHLFSAGGTGFVALNLEFCPSRQVMEWANAVLHRYSNRQAIIATHSFLNAAGQRQDKRECNANHKQGSFSGVDMWNSFIKQNRHENILLILSGHDIWSADGAARRTDTVHGRPVHQLLSNYQHLENGGDGFLRIMTFDPASRKIRVQTYSPYLDAYRVDPNNEFELRW